MPGQKQQAVTKQGLQPAVSVSHASDFILIIRLLNKVHLHFLHEKLGVEHWFGSDFRKIP